MPTAGIARCERCTHEVYMCIYWGFFIHSIVSIHIHSHVTHCYIIISSTNGNSLDHSMGHFSIQVGASTKHLRVFLVSQHQQFPPMQSVEQTFGYSRNICDWSPYFFWKLTRLRSRHTKWPYQISIKIVSRYYIHSLLSVSLSNMQWFFSLKG